MKAIFCIQCKKKRTGHAKYVLLRFFFSEWIINMTRLYILCETVLRVLKLTHTAGARRLEISGK